MNSAQATRLIGRAPVAATATRAPAASSSSTTAPRSARSALEVDLLAQPRAEALERPLRVVAASVEAPVDEPLHAARTGRNSAATTQRRDRDREVRAARERREQRLPSEHEPDVRGAEHQVSAP